MAKKFFTDYSSDVAEGGDMVHIPKMADQFSASDIKTTSGDLTLTNVTDTSYTLNLDNWKGIAFPISDYQARQIHNKYNVLDAYARDMAYKLAKGVDTAIFGQGANITDGVGDSGTDLLATSIEKAISILESNNVPLEDCAFFFHPYAYWREIHKTQKFYDASQFGKGAPTAEGYHSMLYGLPVYIGSQIPGGTAGTEGGHRNLLIHKEALIFAFQPIGGSYVRLREFQPAAHRIEVAADTIYGVGYLRATAGVRIISNN
jgi:hypothetical protein